jgi:signal transduction histidine kinase
VAILVFGFTLTIGALSLLRAVGTIGKPFAGFFYGPNLLVSIGQREGWPGIEKGLRSLDRIESVDGTPVVSGPELAEKISRRSQGDLVTYRVERGGETREIAVPVSRYGLDDFLVVFLAPFLMGLLFVAFGGILFFTQPSARGGLIYLLLCCLIGLFCMAVYEAYTSFAFFRLLLLYPLIGGLFVHLLSHSPESPVTRTRVRALVIAVYLGATALVTLRQIYFLRADESALLSKLSSFYVLLVLLAGLLLLVRAYFRSRTQMVRDKIKVIGIGIFLAGSVVAAWSLNFLLVARSFYLDEGILLAAVFPLFMSYAVVRKNVFELDRVIRLSLSYGISAAVVLVLYLAALGLLREFLPPREAESRHFGFLFVALAGVGALLFNRLRRGVNDLVRRILFRSRFDLMRALSDLDRSLVAGSSASQLAERVAEGLFDLLRLERAAVLCPSTHIAGRAIARTAHWDNPPPLEKWLPWFESEGLAEELRRQARPRTVTRIATDSPGRFRESLALLRASGIEVLVPCVSSGKLFGILLLGGKASRDRWEADELTLLEPIAVRMGIVLENAELSVGADRQARLAAVGQMASVLIHDIKNPLSTIRISAGSIKRRFREGDHAFELATFVEEEVDRMNRTVQGILTYAKPAGLSLRQISVNALVRNVAEGRKPALESAGLRLDVREISPEPLFFGDETLLGRALENLIVNAIEATAPGGVVTVRLLRREGGSGPTRLLFVVEDTGKGMDATTREQVFKPFFTTKPNGTGLGLAIVKQVVTEHGGEVELESRPGNGTRFTLAFPLSPEEKR